MTGVLAPLRVAHLIHRLEFGGAEALLVELGRVAYDLDLRLLVVSLTRVRDRRYLRQLEAAGADVLSLELPTRWDPRAFARAVPALAAWRPAVIHTHLKHADLVGAVAARRLGVPMVSTLHLIEDAPTPVGRLKRRAAAAARRSTAVRTIAVSDELRRWYVRTFPADPARVVTVHNGVPRPPEQSPAARARVRAEVGVPQTAVLAVQVGLLRPGKGHADLLAALRTVPPEIGLYVVLAGDGPLRAELEAAARLLPRPERVRFAGFRDDVPALVDAADLVVHPSHVDALPTALLQALAAGRPIVATRAGGIPEIVTPDVGVLVDPGDVPALSRALAELAGDPGRRAQLGAAATDRFMTHFDVYLWAQRLRRVYEEVLDACPAEA